MLRRVTRRIVVFLFKRLADTSVVRELESTKQELAETKASLKVAEHENGRLWVIAQRDDARVKRERADSDRARAESIVAARLAKMPDEQGVLQ